jgi:asparagine synthase (glutamine-hydrolysing)
MCGIAGYATFDGRSAEQSIVQAMCDSITYRGPDDAGYFVAGPVALGMRRLSIIDLSTGHQPIFNEDRTACVFFNGEIYNYRELREQLIAAGHRFTTQSDTEVIVHLWEEHGLAFPDLLNGMFAIALYDLHAQRLLLVRDHLGIKPLYYAQTPNTLVFGSEIKTILATDFVARTLNIDAVSEFLAWEYVPGTRTLLNEVRRVAPGALLEVDIRTGTVRHESFWRRPRPRPEIASLSPEALADHLDETIAKAVRRQMIADVPLGAFLSGGVDSSLVVAAMGSAHTFSIGFDDPSYDETRWSKRVADRLGVRHTVEIIRPDVRSLFDQLVGVLDDPIGDFSIFPTYLVSKLAREHVKVSLSGDGGDELFGGYEAFVAQERSRYWDRLPAWLRHGVVEPLAAALPPAAEKKGLRNKFKRFVEGAVMDPRLGHARWRLFANDAMRAALFTPAANGAVSTPAGDHILALRADAADLDEVDRTLYVEMRSYMVDNCLTKVDRMSMAASLEVRVPLIDREVVDLAFSLPSALKFHGGQTKILLKRVAARHVPHDCVYRGKQGFSIPIKNWLRKEFAPLLDQYLNPRRVEAEGLFDSRTVQRLRSEHDSGQANHSHLLWGLLVLAKWREVWKVTV